VSGEGRTHFGFRDVDERDKAGLVGEVFRTVAGRYDLMNDLMSFGIHRLWKRFVVSISGVRAGQRVLDVAAGSGDLSALFAPRVGSGGMVVVSDINAAMLGVGRDRLLDAGRCDNLAWVQADAERLPFAEGSFDLVTIGFGLRNVTRIDCALASMHKVLRPGGRLLVLEFSRPDNAALRALYDAYSFNVLPKVGGAVTGSEESYRYLVESIRRHPPQAELGALFGAAGFERVQWYNLSGGIVAAHTGVRL